MRAFYSSCELCIWFKFILIHLYKYLASQCVKTRILLADTSILSSIAGQDRIRVSKRLIRTFVKALVSYAVGSITAVWQIFARK